MGFTLGVLIETLLLFVNAVAILNDERFLSPLGFGNSNDLNTTSVKANIARGLGAVRFVLKIPLIGMNVLIIVYELLLG